MSEAHLSHGEAREALRLTDAQYRILVKLVDRPFVDNDTTPIAAGYKLGVQAVLHHLREGFVIR